MTKAFITIFLFVYSLARVAATIHAFAWGVMLLPAPVMAVTGVCVVFTVFAFIDMVRGNLRRRRIRRLLILTGVCALLNFAILKITAADGLGTLDLIISGTLFDVVFAAGALTLPMRDHPPGSRRKAGKKARIARAKRRKQRMEEELAQSLEQIEQLSLAERQETHRRAAAKEDPTSSPEAGTAAAQPEPLPERAGISWEEIPDDPPAGAVCKEPETQKRI